MNPVTDQLPASCAALLSGMIAIDSVTPKVSGRSDAERELAEFIAGMATGWGLETQWLAAHDDHGDALASNLLVFAPREATHAPGAPWLLFNSHLDTVGVDGMTVAPFGGPDSISDDRVSGRGACDTKGTGASMLWGLKGALAAGALAQPTGVLFTVGEEHAQFGARSFAESDAPQWASRYGSEIGGVVVGEPTHMRVVAETNGFVRARVVAHGVAAHSSRPERGRNAIADMARVVLAIEGELSEGLRAKQKENPRLSGGGAVSVNRITGGAQMNVTPERCEIGVDRRLAPGETPEQAVAEIQSLVERLGDPQMRIEVEPIDSAPPFPLGANEPLARWAVETLTGAGIASQVAGEPYTTDANHLAGAGLRCVVLGPGDIAYAHTHNESIGVEELEEGVRGYRALMEAPAGAG